MSPENTSQGQWSLCHSCKCHAQSMIKKQTSSSPNSPEPVDKETELADLEKIMDSFDAEEEKIIGMIVKLDDDGLPGISDSPPRITLHEAVTPANVVNQEGTVSDTNESKAPLKGVTSRALPENNKIPSHETETALTSSAMKEGVTVEQNESDILHPVTPVNTALKGVTPKPPTLQHTEGVTSHTVGDPNSHLLTPANAVLEGVTPKTPVVQSSNV